MRVTTCEHSRRPFRHVTAAGLRHTMTGLITIAQVRRSPGPAEGGAGTTAIMFCRTTVEGSLQSGTSLGELTDNSQRGADSNDLVERTFQVSPRVRRRLPQSGAHPPPAARARADPSARRPADRLRTGAQGSKSAEHGTTASLQCLPLAALHAKRADRLAQRHHQRARRRCSSGSSPWWLWDGRLVGWLVGWSEGAGDRLPVREGMPGRLVVPRRPVTTSPAHPAWWAGRRTFTHRAAKAPSTASQVMASSSSVTVVATNQQAMP